MIAEQWEETIGLRFIERTVEVRVDSPSENPRKRLRILQHRWKRKCGESRSYGGRDRWVTWYEYEWRDVPLEAEAATAAPGPQPGDLDFPDSAVDTEVKG